MPDGGKSRSYLSIVVLSWDDEDGDEEEEDISTPIRPNQGPRKMA